MYELAKSPQSNRLKTVVQSIEIFIALVAYSREDGSHGLHV